ncbi:CD48 antigen [Trachinotus anak]|uniref:CD48 antigen n=1 Tax=Trachinotus anak TaxID=443729 RepID=UPI0039F1F90E
MTLQIILIVLLQVFTVTPAESAREVPGYLGASVTLRSGADPSWNLAKIEWSIFSNNTWIATYRRGKENIDRVSRYKGRLSLNISSGDLMIHNLNSEDAMEYTVVLINTMKNNTVNKVKLKVMEHLEEPSIETRVSATIKGSCWVELNCSSQDEGVDLSWEVKPGPVTAYSMNNPDGKPGILLAFLSTTQKSNMFTCTSNRTTERVSKTVTLNCDDEIRVRCGLWFFFGLFTGLVILVLYIFKGKIKDALTQLKDKHMKT